ncbi:chromosome condensation protein CrcB [Halobacteriales archaeon QS_1_68_20]|nr:MAG: chromosome condensation protein CrcB [Halobacteriales archaeon QS_1_68_20]
MERRPLVALELAVLIALGGFAGANLRYAVGLAVPGLPGTLLVNAAGSFALGFLVYEARYAGILPERTHVVVGTGFLSSFTTYSTFVLQSAQAPPALLVANVVSTYALGFAGAVAGRELAGVVADGRPTPAREGAD